MTFNVSWSRPIACWKSIRFNYNVVVAGRAGAASQFAPAVLNSHWKEFAPMRFRRTKFRKTLHKTMLRSLGPLMGPLMGLLALGSPLLSEPLALWSRCAVAHASGHPSELRLASNSSLFLHPLASLLRLAAAGSPSSNRIQEHRNAVLGWDALRYTPLGGSVWMVRDHRPAIHRVPSVTLLRC
jgi:hypothetical protein